VCPISALPPAALYRSCDPASIPFDSTADARRDETFLGQDRAVEAVHFGITVRREGYNLFAAGPSGVGKQSLLRRMLQRQAAQEAAGDDWCYVHNFDDSRRPRALRLPAGRGSSLCTDMERTVAEIQVAMRAAFEGEEYRTRKQKLVRELKDRQDRAFQEVEARAKKTGVAILHEEDVFSVLPLRKKKVLSPAMFERLPEHERATFKSALRLAEDALEVMLQQFNDWDRQHREALQALDRATAASVGSRVFGSLRAKYTDQPAVLEYLSAVEADLEDSAEEFVAEEDPPSPETGSHFPLGGESSEGSSFELRASINLLIDHAGQPSAPMVYEDHPTYANLMGRIEYASQFGSLIPDFTLIKPGALHRARGGYLIVDADRLLQNPTAYEALKRSLRSGEIRLESLGQAEAAPTVSLEPDPIPFGDTKLVLLGERELYDILVEQDPDFLELFKVLVEFDERMDRVPETEVAYACLLAALVEQEGLRDFSRTGVARVMEHAARLAEDSAKLSLRMRHILDLMREADACAGRLEANLVSAEHVQAAIDGQLRRAGHARERMLEEVKQGAILIDTAGLKAGQVNGLTVFQSGDQDFGLVTRITARVRVGKGEVIDIEREVNLGGPFHSKGVLILSGYLGARYATSTPLSLSASLVFEQSYAAIEGDSASLAEACALMSALANLPVKQSLAVTGSMNQHGEVQAIGGVNEKIEGFFDVCSAFGLNGTQGVLIPRSNVRHLVLRRDVVAAARAGQFHIWPVDTLDTALELLIGKTAGQRDVSGRFPQDSVNEAVEQRLLEFAESSRRFIKA
jgi:lon-related putative ATP-dependent protease